MCKTNPQPLFSLTAEEVDIVKTALEMSRDICICDAMLKGLSGDDYEAGPNGFKKLLARIKQWQDEMAKPT